MNVFNSKVIKEKKKSPFITYANFECKLVPKNNGGQNTEDIKNIYQKIKKILLVVMAVNKRVLMISLVSLLKHI